MATVHEESISLTKPCAIGPTGRPYAAWKLVLASPMVLGVGRVAGPEDAVSVTAAAAADAAAAAASAAAALFSLPPRPKMARTAARGGTAAEAQAAERTAAPRTPVDGRSAAASAMATHDDSAARSSGFRINEDDICLARTRECFRETSQ
jgi:hypothetical protein